jgi:CHAT domain-containing protein/tetratricopeptide (TPR) repeat protein
MSRNGAVLPGIFALVIWGAPPTPPALGERHVEPGVPAESQLAPGLVDRYEISLRAGQFLHLSIEQNHLDASVRILSAAGAELAEADNAADEDDPITLSVVAAKDETHGIEIRLRNGRSAPGKYRLSLDPPRAATAEDTKRIEAERVRSEGDALLARSTADTSRKAIELYEKAILGWREIGDRREEAATLDRITDTLGWLGDLRPALERGQQSLALWREIGDRRGESSALDEVGLAHSRIGEQRQGIEFFEQALALRREDHNVRGLAETLNNMAQARSALGETPEAIARYTEAIENAHAFGDPAIEATMRKNRAVNYAVLGELDRAFADLSSALSEFRRLEDHHQEGVALYSLGNVYLDRGEAPAALRHYRLALPLLRKAGDRVAEAATVNHLGLAELTERQPKAALDAFENARELLHASGDLRREAAVMANIARAHLEMGDASGARDRFLEALPLIQAKGDRGNEATDLVHLARAERALGNLEEAHARMEEALRLTESLRGSIPALGERALFMAKTRDRYDLLIDILMDLHARHPEQGWDAEALHASERAKARSLVDLLAEARIDLRQGIDPDLLARERSLESQIETRRRDAERKLAEPAGSPSAAEGPPLDALLSDYEDVEGKLRTANPRYAALERPQPLTATEIRQQVLDPDTLLLEYDLGDERGFVWAVTAGGITSHALPPRAVIETAARRVYEAWSAGTTVDGSEAARRATKLSRMLLAPVARELGRKRIAVVGEEALLYVPFAALPSPDRGFASPLLSGHEVVCLPSATTLAVLRREVSRRSVPDRRVAVLADPVFDRDDRRVLGRDRASSSPADAPPNEELTRSMHDAGLPRLERLAGSRKEAEGIAALAGKGSALMALDFQASRPTAMGAEVSRSRIVHFATHAFLDGRHPELSGIVLSLVDEKGRPADGFLQTRDVYKLELSADLVVLSACQTALGKEVRGEGLLGFSRGFMYAGAPRVVASLWRVPDRATSELMKRFYRGILADGLRPAAALRASQTAMQRDRRWSSPYYWAAFTLQGDWN